MQVRVYLRMLQEGWWLIALSSLSALLIALILAYTTMPLYRATARFLISPNVDVISGRDAVNSLTALDKRVIGVTYAEVLSSERIYRDTSNALQIDYNILRGYKLSAVVLPEASILEFSASGPNPTIAALFANGAGQQGIEYIKSLYDVYTITFLDAAQLPREPYNTNPMRNAALALALGMTLGAGLALLLGHLRPPLNFIRQQASIDGSSLAYTRSYALQQVDALPASPSEPVALGIVRLEGLRDAARGLPHLVYQRLLRQVTGFMHNELRPDDLVGRWDECTFLVVLPGANEATAQQVVQRISAQLDQPLTIIGNEQLGLKPRSVVMLHTGAAMSNALSEVIDQELARTRHSGAPSVVSASASA